MYGLSFQPSESLKALVYFEGGDLRTLSSEVKAVLIKAAAGVRDLPPIVLAAHELVLPSEEFKPEIETAFR
jgi:hypothetical protein